MPELPELEVLKRGLAKAVVGRKIVRVTVNKKECVNVSPRRYRQMVEGATIERAWRKGKMALLDLDNGNTLLIHLSLGGRLVLADPSDYEPKDVQIHYQLDDGSHLLAAKFMFANVHVRPTDELDQDSRLGGMGRDALDDPPSVDELRQMLAGRRMAIKAFLMDQTALAGIGNLYANEILFAARIHPQTPTHALSRGDVETLHGAVRTVLRQAIRDGGASEGPFTNLHGKRGRVQDKVKVMWRAGEECLECGGEIKEIRQANRASYLCPKCQKKRRPRRPKKKPR